ncbi:unnamed protein product [Zymoseptoria tritici ST99CH_1A5]|uniref:C2H2-type domain-containing protein n=1 Tax=Zymoseptoria tritici ST99CH_1A5 TaxID=1276529 RepID=A0A1Y6LY77_ZYMTR|nr:unnamed protein product [Zymoseptoria tritici ST99CH_3D1]SMY29344.1 unnamed protein product [Zymoseptoria tritici ST99CH_1A5]
MANSRTNNPGLPGMSELTSGFLHCPSCPRYFTSLPELDLHQRQEQHFTLHANLAHRPATYGARRVPLDYTYDITSPGSSSGSDSDGIFTPSASRASSPYSSNGHGSSRPYRRTSQATNRRDSRQDPLTVRQANNPSKMEKKDKEKFSRSEQGAVPIREESFHEFYGGWRLDEQSSGNGTGSGTYAKKITLQRGSEKIMNYFAHKDWCRARIQGPEAMAQWKQEYEDLMDATDEEMPPLMDTLLYDPNEQLCNHADSKSKACIVHGHPDWRECRRMRHAAIYKRNVAEFDRQHGLTKIISTFSERAYSHWFLISPLRSGHPTHTLQTLNASQLLRPRSIAARAAMLPAVPRSVGAAGVVVPASGSSGLPGVCPAGCCSKLRWKDLLWYARLRFLSFVAFWSLFAFRLEWDSAGLELRMVAESLYGVY